MENRQDNTKNLTKEDVHRFLDENCCAVLSTSRPAGGPDAAPVYFTIDPDTFTIDLLTKEETQKCRNIRTNNRITLTVVNSLTLETVKIVGRAAEVQEQGEVRHTMEDLAKKIRHGERIEGLLPILKHQAGALEVLRITPSLIQYRKYREEDYLEKTIEP